MRTLILAVVMVFSVNASGQDLEPGDAARPFDLFDQHGNRHRLADYRGQWLVMYFYPKDDTPGCTREACEFRDDYLQLKRMQVKLLGVSTDDAASHRAFADKYGLPFPLLSDANGRVASEYGALWSLGPIRFARRHSFIIDPDGRVARVYRKVKPAQHSDEVIADLRSLGVREPGSEGVPGSE